MPNRQPPTPPQTQENSSAKVSHQDYQNVDLHILAEKVFRLLKEDLRVTRERVGHRTSYK